MSSSSSWADIVAQDTGDKNSTSLAQEHKTGNSDEHDQHHRIQQASSNQNDATSSGGREHPLGDFPLPQETLQDSDTALPSSAGVGDLLKQSAEHASTDDIMHRSYAFVTDFPPPQATATSAGNSNVPTSAGVGDLLHTNNDRDKKDPTTPPHPDRSFASVAGNKDFPDLQPSTSEAPSASSTESLSDLPDVKDMLSSQSVKIPPPPPSKSFAKMAAKPAPVEDVPSDHRLATEKQNAEIARNNAPNPAQKTHENFPTLAQSNMMAEHHASSRERGMFTAISELSQSVDAATSEEAFSDQAPTSGKKTFADVTGSNLDKAPPSASPRPVERHPVYNEDAVMKESARREMRKWHQKEPEEEITPEMEQIEHERHETAGTKSPNKALEKQIQFFDQRREGKITMWDTFSALRRLGYWWFTAIPTTILLHLRLSPFTSPYRFPFIYRSLYDILTLPIYTDRIGQTLASQLPMSSVSKTRELVRKHGRSGPGGVRGIGFWDGFWGMRDMEGYKWWQIAPWHLAPRFIHRLQWFFAYTMLQDPVTHLVTETTLTSLRA
ncbi:hypothetical protein BX666DRAFT_1976181 [Dichotomocladium elegans]|nr:hypothetical protein BX666DRAFT_1976181 [Dichotomocladium elegans]